MTQYPPTQHPLTPYPPPAWPGHGYPVPPARPRNGLGVAALAIAVIGLVCSISIVGGIACGIVAIIVGLSGRRRAARGMATNGDVATAGIALGAVAVVVSLGVIAIWVRGYQEVDFSGYVNCLSQKSDQQHVEQCANEFRQRVEDKFGLGRGQL